MNILYTFACSNIIDAARIATNEGWQYLGRNLWAKDGTRGRIILSNAPNFGTCIDMIQS